MAEPANLEPTALIDFLMRQATETPHAAEITTLYLEAAAVCERELGDLKKAIGFYQQALKIDGENLRALKALSQAYYKAQAWEEALKVQGQVVNFLATHKVPPKSPEYLGALMEQANLCLQRLGREGEAQTFYQKILELEPQHGAAAQALENLYLIKKDWRALTTLLERTALATPQEEERVSLLYRLALIARHNLEDPDRAAAHLQEVLKLRPAHLPSLKILQQIALAKGDFTRLAELYEQLAGAVKSPEERHRFLSQAARTWAQELGNRERALFCLERIVKEDPQNWQSLEELREHYRGKEAFADVKRVLILQLHLAKEPNLVRSLRYALADVLERTGDVKEAINQYRLILKDAPRDLPALRTLGALYTKDEDWPSLIELYENELAETEEPALVLSLALRLATLYERTVKNLEKAIVFTQRAVDLWPQNTLLTWQLQRLYTLASDWPKLAASLRDELQQTTDERRKCQVLERLAELSQDHFHDADRAASYYQELLKLNPRDVNVIQRLSDILAETERWQDLASLIGGQVAQAGNSPQAVSLYLQAAEIFEAKLSQPETALHCYQQAFAIAPQHLPTIHALGSFLSRRRDFPRLIELFQRELALVQDQEQQASIYFRMGEIFQRDLAQPENAIACFRYALQLRPEFHAAQDAFMETLEAQGNWTEWVTLVGTFCAALSDPQYRSLRFLNLAQMRLAHTRDLEGALGDLHQALAANPQNLGALNLMAEIYEQEKKWPELAELLGRFIGETRDPAWKLALAARLAEIRESYLHDTAGAIAIWEKVLAEEPQNLLALEGLEQIFRREQQWQGLAKVLSHRLQLELRAGRVASTVPLLQELADLSLLHFKDAPRACASYQKILEIDPTRRDVYEKLYYIYSQASRFQELAELLRNQVQTLSSNNHAKDELVGLYQELGFLYEHRLKRIPDAITAWEQVRKVQPQDLLLFKSLERLYLGTRDLQSLANLYEEFAGFVRVRDERVRILILAGEIFAGRLEQADRARAVFEKAVEIDPQQGRAWEALKTLYEKVENWAKFIQVNERLLALCKEQSKEPQEQSTLLKQSARVFEEYLREPQKALAALTQASALAPKDLDITRSLVRLHRQQKAWEEVLGHYAHWVAQIDDPPHAVSVYQERGMVLEDELKQSDYALLHYEKALAIDPLYLPALERLSQIHLGRRDWEKARDYMERLAVCEKERDRKKAVLVSLGDIYRQGFQDAERALLKYEEALALDSRLESALQRVGEIYEAKKDFPKLCQILEKSLAQLPKGDSPEAVTLLMKLAATFGGPLKQVDRAATEYRKVLKIDSNYVPAQVGLAELFGRHTESGYTTQALNEHRQVLLLDPGHAETYRSLAKLYEKTSQYDKMFCLYQILNLFGVASQTERGFLQDNQARVGREFKQALSTDDRARYLVAEDAAGSQRDFLVLLGPALDKVFKGDLSKYNFKKSDRVMPQAKNPLREVSDAVAVGFGIAEYDFYMGKETSNQNEMVNTEPPSLVFSPNILKKVGRDEQRYVFGSTLVLAKERFDLYFKMKGGELGMVMRAFRKGTQAQARKSEPNFAADEERIFKEIDKNIPRKDRKEITDFGEKMRAENEKFDEAKFRRGIDLTLMRAGLVAAIDLSVALSALGKLDPQVAAINFKEPKSVGQKIKAIPSLRNLLLFAASDEYFALRKRLGVALL